MGLKITVTRGGEDSPDEVWRARNRQLLALIPRLAGQANGHVSWIDLVELVDAEGWTVEEVNRFIESWPDAGAMALGHLLAMAGVIRKRYGVGSLGDVIDWTHAICRLTPRGGLRPSRLVEPQLRDYKLGRDPIAAVPLYIEASGSQERALADVLAGTSAGVARRNRRERGDG
jgi:hypothetical protein